MDLHCMGRHGGSTHPTKPRARTTGSTLSHCMHEESMGRMRDCLNGKTHCSSEIQFRPQWAKIGRSRSGRRPCRCKEQEKEIVGNRPRLQSQGIIFAYLALTTRAPLQTRGAALRTAHKDIGVGSRTKQLPIGTGLHSSHVLTSGAHVQGRGARCEGLHFLRFTEFGPGQRTVRIPALLKCEHWAHFYL